LDSASRKASRAATDRHIDRMGYRSTEWGTWLIGDLVDAAAGARLEHDLASTAGSSGWTSILETIRDRRAAVTTEGLRP